MISSRPWRGRAPGRLNLIGEHVDYMGGLVLPCAIDRWISLSGRRAQRWRVQSRVGGGGRYLRALGAELGCPAQAVEVESDLPAGAGLSSSAALLVAAAAGLAPELDGVAAALACQRAERSARGVEVGIMDPFACALARRGHALLLDCSSLEHRQLALPEGLVLAVIDSGVQRRLQDTPYAERRAQALAGEPRRLRHVESEIARVREFADALKAGDRRRLGALLALSHASLRDDFEVSTELVDAIVDRAQKVPGCLGARLTGAGFGGSVFALLEEGAQSRLAAALSGLQILFCQSVDGAFR